MNKKAVSRSRPMETVFFLEVLCVVFNIVFAGLGMRQLVSFAIAANYILTACLLILLLIERSVYERNTFLAYAGILIISLLGVVLSSKTLSFSYLRKWLIFFCTFTLFFWATYVRITPRMIKDLKYAAIFLACFFCVMYVQGRTYPLGTVGITFNLGNPNFTGMWLLAEMVLLASFIPREKKLWQKLFFFTLILAMVYFIALTNARSILVAIAFFLFVSLVVRKKYTRLILVAAIYFPLIFAVIYMQVVDADWFYELFAFIVSEGKGLNSRVGIWNRGFGIFLNSPFLGNYYRATDGSGIGQLHNIYVDTLAAYGGIVQALILSLLTRLVGIITKNGLENAQRIALYAFGAVLISGTFEAGLFANSQGLYVLVAGLLMLARDKQNVI